ncbi:hypothetical protein HYY71_02065 [Candidatus Woesearchaeota archaeon]|nr:hypothetical protein [Candidatus Woesearchaeota archaeon]
MRINNFLTLLLIFSIAMFGCTQAETTIEKEGAMMEKDAKGVMEKSEDSMEKADTIEKEGEMMKNDEAMMEKSQYAGKALAGTESTKYQIGAPYAD